MHDFQSIFEKISYKVAKVAAFCFLQRNSFNYVTNRGIWYKL
ncbi:hypothetical protein CcarbDRAFT_1706 [Clostridium carboxidivorans P7]|uniref:Uncharacterized protein n=1 Tax=Clostridium carboxidivorans P7 TaxID=536227 RepID=C6PSD9_9CLOT|nr:hypothetical protein [Clostridium carboxidivorans]EET87817.1 hypothetical protein CcarbDRAFT_1706 [Clostridium carboxidivorans P7]EFG90189.1 hypothetical protein CLCAR_0395 [Clostridium carboxidivorans P7]